MIDLKRTTARDPDFHFLVAELDKELWQRYPDTQQNFAPHNKIDLSARVIIAYADNLPVGCGCFRPMDETSTIEIKRMYVVPSSRGRGVAKSVLGELEKWGKEQGFVQAKLETGKNQPEAISVYQRSRYQQIPNYPPYQDMKESICMAKQLN